MSLGLSLPSLPSSSLGSSVGVGCGGRETVLEGIVVSVLDRGFEERVGLSVGLDEGNGSVDLEDGMGGVGLDEGMGEVDFDVGTGGVGFEVGSIGVDLEEDEDKGLEDEAGVVGFEEGTGGVNFEVDFGGVGVFVDFRVGIEIEGRITLVAFVVGVIVDRMGEDLDVDKFPGSEKVGSIILVGVNEEIGIVGIEIGKDGRTTLVGFTDGKPTDEEIFTGGVDGDGNTILVGFAEEG